MWQVGFHDGSVDKNLPCNAGDSGSIPGQGTKIPNPSGQLSLCATTTERVPAACAPKQGTLTPQLEKTHI